MAEKTDIISETYIALRGRMTAMIGRMLSSPDDVSDVIQETFCRLWTRRGAIESASEAAALATTTAKNICIDRLRAEKRHPSVSVDEERDASPARGVDDSYEAEEQYAIVRRIIDGRLSPMQRKVMEMYEEQDMSYEEIARALGMDETAVRMNMSRARKTIRLIYEEMNK